MEKRVDVGVTMGKRGDWLGEALSARLLVDLVDVQIQSAYFGGYFLSLFFLRFYLFIFRERGRGEKERETSVYGCLSCGPHWGPGLQPRHVPLLGTEPATPWFAAHAQSTEPRQPGRLLSLLL